MSTKTKTISIKEANRRKKQSQQDKAKNAKGVVVKRKRRPTALNRMIYPFANGTLQAFKRYQDQSTNKYILGLLDPELAIKRDWKVKCPSPYPTPTFSISVCNEWTLGPNTQGKALITWRPNMLQSDMYREYLEAKTRAMVTNDIRERFQYEMDQGNVLSLDNIDLQGVTIKEIDYSQVTICTDNDLDGEDTTTHCEHQFQRMKPLKLPITKYRLVGAKLKIVYDGRNDDESGTIIGGQYLGKLAPMNKYQTYVNGLVTYHNALNQEKELPIASEPAAMNMGYDDSDEMRQFQQFDNIKNLNYVINEPVIKGKAYNFYAYPVDHSYYNFESVGEYGGSQEIAHAYTTLFGGTDKFYHNAIFMSDYQDGQFGSVTTADTYNEIELNTYLGLNNTVPKITIPSYVIGLSNIASTRDCIHVYLYEIYECICTPDMNQIATQNIGIGIPQDQLINAQNSMISGNSLSQSAQLVRSYSMPNLQRSRNPIRRK